MVTITRKLRAWKEAGVWACGPDRDLATAAWGTTCFKAIQNYEARQQQRREAEKEETRRLNHQSDSRGRMFFGQVGEA